MMKTRISALVDGELEDHDVAEVLRALRQEPGLRADWADYQLTGAALRGEAGLAIDVTASVMSALELEPTVMAPKVAQQRHRPEWKAPALALAASVAGVAVVAWLGFGSLGEMRDSGGVVAGAGQLVTPTAPVEAPSTPRIQEYLVAHQAYAPAGAITSGARSNIRTVAMVEQKH